MSCKMVDAMIDAAPAPQYYFVVRSDRTIEHGPNVHYTQADNPLANKLRKLFRQTLPDYMQWPYTLDE